VTQMIYVGMFGIQMTRFRPSFFDFNESTHPLHFAMFYHLQTFKYGTMYIWIKKLLHL